MYEGDDNDQSGRDQASRDALTERIEREGRGNWTITNWNPLTLHREGGRGRSDSSDEEDDE